MGGCDRLEVMVWVGMCLQTLTLCDFLLASNTWLR